jgi:NTE family protein
MAAAMTKSSANTIEIGLVLQGGGALGAYEYGGIIALIELIGPAVDAGQVTLRAVTGVSIGAINAACVVGSTSFTDAQERLRTLWSDLAIESPPFLPAPISRNLALFSVPHFYSFRSDFLTMPSWTYLYDTAQLLQTLAQRVDFAALNANKTAFLITAVDVLSGELKRFANQTVGKVAPTAITPEHILASGSLPPQFPWTKIGGADNARYYWDGGIVDNTPLGAAIDAFTPGDNIGRVLVVMNLFPATAKRLPVSFTEVDDRLNQLRFGNRLHQDSENADQISDLISTIEDLVKCLPGGIPKNIAPKVQEARKLKSVKTIEITLTQASDADDSFHDFSREGIEKRRLIGRDITLKQLAQARNQGVL